MDGWKRGWWIRGEIQLMLWDWNIAFHPVGEDYTWMAPVSRDDSDVIGLIFPALAVFYWLYILYSLFLSISIFPFCFRPPLPFWIIPSKVMNNSSSILKSTVNINPKRKPFSSLHKSLQEKYNFRIYFKKNGASSELQPCTPAAKRFSVCHSVYFGTRGLQIESAPVPHSVNPTIKDYDLYSSF